MGKGVSVISNYIHDGYGYNKVVDFLDTYPYLIIRKEDNIVT